MQEIIILLKGEAKERYEELQNKKEKTSQQIIRAISRLKEILEQNPQYGDPIKKELIKKVYPVIQNLYRIELPGYWRMIYTLESDGKNLFIFILFIGNHKEYNKLFGYH